MNGFFLLLLIPVVLAAQQNQNQPYVSPQKVERQLKSAEDQYKHALKLFNPWYTGPLVTPSASMCPPGMAVTQPYLYFTDNYGAFDEDRHRVDAPNQFSIKPSPLIFLQTGITPSVDTTVIMGTVASWEKGKFSGGFQDTTVQLGFLINNQTLWIPQAKFTITQSFPTGKYNHLDPKNLGLDATGAGAWGTTFSLNFGKLLFWDTLHPFNTRVSFNYTVFTPIHVSNFNAYGGGYGTEGTVHPGSTFAADLGLELSIDQPWVVALDVVYNCTNRTKFNGALGTTTPGGAHPSSVGTGYSDQLSLAPAVEYNFNENMGLLWGVWFTVYGRNAPNFVSGIVSWEYAFP